MSSITLTRSASTRTNLPTTVIFPTTFTAVNTPSPTSSNNNNNVTSSSSLYLYTFLATLVLLLGVSSAIVLRSLVLRRRHRRMVDEAIRNGTWPPPSAFGAGRNRRDFGEKPNMFSAHLGLDGNVILTEKGRDVQWDEVVPVSSLYVSNPPTTTTAPGTGANTPGGPSATGSQTPGQQPNNSTSRVASAFNLQSRLRLPFARNTNTNPSTTSLPVSVKNSVTDPSSESQPPVIQVSVLIAMPSPTPFHLKPRKSDDEEEELPHLEFGVAHVEVIQDDLVGEKLKARDSGDTEEFVGQGTPLLPPTGNSTSVAS